MTITHTIIIHFFILIIINYVVDDIKKIIWMKVGKKSFRIKNEQLLIWKGVETTLLILYYYSTFIYMRQKKKKQI